MFVSFRDPSENPNAWASFGPNPIQSQSLKYDELFGAGTSLSGNEELNMSSLGGVTNSDELMPFAFLPDLSNGSGGSQFGGLSPISHLPTPPSATGTVGPQTTFTSPSTTQQLDLDMSTSPSKLSSLVAPDGTPVGLDHGKPCPKTKQDFAEIIEKSGVSTFGPSANPAVAAGVTDAESCAKMSLADATKLNLDIGTAWRAVRQHPQFEVRSDCGLPYSRANMSLK